MKIEYIGDIAVSAVCTVHFAGVTPPASVAISSPKEGAYHLPYGCGMTFVTHTPCHPEATPKDLF